MTKRITVKSFIDAVKKTGVVPARCLWISQRSGKGGPKVHACGIGALATANGIKDGTQARAWAKSNEGLGLSPEYVSGYITAFDGIKRTESQLEKRDYDYQIGYEDGYACAVAAFDEKLHEEYAASWDVDMTPYLTPDPGEDELNYQYTTF